MLPDVIVINLARRSEHRRILGKSLRDAGFASISWVDAVDWHELDTPPPFKARELPPVHPYRGWCDPYARRAMTLGEVGCSLSHILAWQRVVETDRPALILEDDAILVKDLVSQIPHVLYDLSCLDFSLCYFSQRNDEGACALAGRLIHTVNYHPVWTMAYMVTPLGARTVLSTPWQTHLIPSDELLPAAFALNRDSSLNSLYAGKGAVAGSRGIVVSTFQRFFTSGSNSFVGSETEKSPAILEENNSFLALSVATEEKDELRRLCRSSERYGFSFEVLGMGEPWNGGDMNSGTGGGQKVNLLRSRLKGVSSDTVILFTDGYDVIVNGYVNDILAKWRSMGEKVVFAAERFCWPDSEYSELYPSCETPYRFLNSGIFMGRAGDLRSLLRSKVLDSEDDQRYYTKLFLGLSDKKGNKSKSRSSNGSVGHIISDKIILDTSCSLFQCLNGSLNDIFVDEGRGMLYNSITKTWPCVIHANGPVKDWLEGKGKSIGGRYRRYYGSMEIGI